MWQDTKLQRSLAAAASVVNARKQPDVLKKIKEVTVGALQANEIRARK